MIAALTTAEMLALAAVACFVPAALVLLVFAWHYVTQPFPDSDPFSTDRHDGASL